MSRKYYPFIKSFLDRLFAILLLVILFPFLSFIYLIIRLNLGKPVFFRQLRPGMKGKVFELIKFRTMRRTRDINGNLLEDKFRITFLGNILRKTSIDELPGLINIIKGQMSFIGPRPLLVDYLDLYSKEQKKRHDVLPGFSGWSQINGRNKISWSKKFKLDVWYVENQNFFLDLKIFFITVFKIIFCVGVNKNDGNTMEKFTGNE